MKQIIISIAAVFSLMAASAQVDPAIPAVPKKQQVPVPKTASIKPDLTIEIVEVIEAVYNPADKTTTIKADVVVYNNSDAASNQLHQIAAYIYTHSTTNIDRVFWHLVNIESGTSLPARATVKRRMLFKIRDIMPPLGVPYRFKLKADIRYVIDEADETNNESNEVSVMVVQKSDL